MLVTSWIVRRVREFAGPEGFRRAVVYGAAALAALLLAPVALLILFVDALEWLARLVPALRRQRHVFTWAGALVVFLALGSIGAVSDTGTGEPTDGGAAKSSATPSAVTAVEEPTQSVAAATPIPTLTPAPTAALTPSPTPSPSATTMPLSTPTPSATTPTVPFLVLKPANGATVSSPSATTTVSGTGPAGATVVRDIFLRPDTTAVAGPDGTWSMPVELSEGSNELTFRVGDDRSTEVKVSVTYVKTAPAATIGKPVTIDGIQITIRKVEWTEGSTFWHPPKGYIWVGYKITMKAVEESRVVSSSDFVALADGTKQGEWTITGDEDWQPLLSLTELRAGASTTGWIAFEMPKPAKYIRLIYDPSFFSDEAKLTLDTRFP